MLNFRFDLCFKYFLSRQLRHLDALLFIFNKKEDVVFMPTEAATASTESSTETILNHISIASSTASPTTAADMLPTEQPTNAAEIFIDGIPNGKPGLADNFFENVPVLDVETVSNRKPQKIASITESDLPSVKSEHKKDMLRQLIMLHSESVEGSAVGGIEEEKSLSESDSEQIIPVMQEIPPEISTNS